MRTIIFIKGSQGVGKSVVAQKIGESIEVHSLEDAEKAAKNRPPYSTGVVENIVFTSNNSFEYPEISKKLKELCKKHPRKFIEVSLSGSDTEGIEVVDAEEIKADIHIEQKFNVLDLETSTIHNLVSVDTRSKYIYSYAKP